MEGWQALALREDLESMQKSELTGSVILLPFFDAYVLGIGRGRDIEPILSQPYQKLVYRPQGWISAVVLLDGVMKGTWELKSRASQTVVKLKMFSSPSAALRRALETEAERLGEFLSAKITLEVELL